MRREPEVLEGGEGALLGRLVEQPARLHLGVLSVAVGEQLFPDHPLPGEAPDPDLLAGLLVARRVAHHPDVVVMPVRAEEIRLPPEDVVRLVPAEVVVLVPAEVAPRGVDGPGGVLSGVAQATGARVGELEVAAHRDADVHPRVVRLLQRRGVVPEGGRAEGRVGGAEPDLEPPGRAGKEIERADDAAHAAVGVGARHVVHRCRDIRRVADDAVVGLDAAAGPGAAHGDVAELHHLVEIDERPAGPLVHGVPDLAADFRQDHHLEVGVLELDHLPGARLGDVGKAVEAEVGVDPADDRDRVRVAEGIGGEHPLVFADGGARRLRGQGGGEAGDGETGDGVLKSYALHGFRSLTGTTFCGRVPHLDASPIFGLCSV